MISGVKCCIVFVTLHPFICHDPRSCAFSLVLTSVAWHLALFFNFLYKLLLFYHLITNWTTRALRADAMTELFNISQMYYYLCFWVDVWIQLKLNWTVLWFLTTTQTDFNRFINLKLSALFVCFLIFRNIFSIAELAAISCQCFYAK